MENKTYVLYCISQWGYSTMCETFVKILLKCSNFDLMHTVISSRLGYLNVLISNLCWVEPQGKKNPTLVKVVTLVPCQLYYILKYFFSKHFVDLCQSALFWHAFKVWIIFSDEHKWMLWCLEIVYQQYGRRQCGRILRGTDWGFFIAKHQWRKKTATSVSWRKSILKVFRLQICKATPSLPSATCILWSTITVYVINGKLTCALATVFLGKTTRR